MANDINYNYNGGEEGGGVGSRYMQQYYTVAAGDIILTIITD